MRMGTAGPGSRPKRMVMGPCGGVRADGSCEVAPRPCVFAAPAEWTGPAPAPVPPRTEADEQSDRIGRLLRSGELACELMVLSDRNGP
jgi:hypothetical protein